MSSIAVLRSNSWGEYQHTERDEYDGDLSDYLGEAAYNVEIEVCPDDALPVTHNCNGATILRITHHNGGENQEDDYYTYEAFWADEDDE